MLLVFANLPTETVTGGSNVLSALAESAVGKWLRVWVVVDASIVLSAGVLTGKGISVSHSVYFARGLCMQQVY